MEKSSIRIDQDGVILLENARILYRNFAGAGGDFNHEGDSNFCVFIDDPNAAQDLSEIGWNVKIRKPRDEDDEVAHYIKVNVSYKFRAPKVFLHTSRNVTELFEDVVRNPDPRKNTLDNADIISCDMAIAPSRWERNGKSGVSGYLRELHVTIREDYFSDKYSKIWADESPEE